MKALAIIPGKGNIHMIDIAEPHITKDDEVKLQVLQIGICGTDREEISGGRADAPEGENELIIGHEMLGRVVATGASVSSVNIGDYALFTVRRGCGQCTPCLKGRSDMCRTGKYKERGIKEYNGFQTEFVIDHEEFLVKVPQEIVDIGVLAEPASIVEKAINQALLLQASRLEGIVTENWMEGKNALVAGLGPIGLLAALFLRARGANVFGLDIVDEDSPRPLLLKEIDGVYIDGRQIKAENIDEHCGDMDFVFEATGIAKLEFQLMDTLGMNGVYVITGIPDGERPVNIMGGALISQMVLKNNLMVGSVNAGINHYSEAIEDLIWVKAKWDHAVSALITSKVPVDRFYDAFSGHRPEDIKTVIEWQVI